MNDLEEFFAKGSPLGKTPKQWVGLTDEEIKNSMRGHNTQVEFARALEAKLKEKNEV
jgi:hypothetical protein